MKDLARKLFPNVPGTYLYKFKKISPKFKVKVVMDSPYNSELLARYGILTLKVEQLSHYGDWEKFSG